MMNENRQGRFSKESLSGLPVKYACRFSNGGGNGCTTVSRILGNTADTFIVTQSLLSPFCWWRIDAPKIGSLWRAFLQAPTLLQINLLASLRIICCTKVYRNSFEYCIICLLKWLRFYIPMDLRFQQNLLLCCRSNQIIPVAALSCIENSLYTHMLLSSRS